MFLFVLSSTLLLANSWDVSEDFDRHSEETTVVVRCDVNYNTSVIFYLPEDGPMLVMFDGSKNIEGKRDIQLKISISRGDTLYLRGGASSSGQYMIIDSEARKFHQALDSAFRNRRSVSFAVSTTDYDYTEYEVSRLPSSSTTAFSMSSKTRQIIRKHFR